VGKPSAVDVGLYTRVIQVCFPQISVRGVKPIVHGWDYLVLEVNGEFIFRFPRGASAEAQLEKEIALLPALTEALPIPVPHFEFVANGCELWDKRFAAYRKIEGVPLTTESLESVRSSHPAAGLSHFLSKLHRFPVSRAVQLKAPDADPAGWRGQYCNMYHQVEEQVFPRLSAAGRSKAAALWEDFLTDEGNYQFKPVLVHADLAGEHILCDLRRAAISGVIDWGDACIGDPALDFAGLLNDCGPHFAREVLAGYRGDTDETFWLRVVFYARIIPFHEILFGLDTNDEECVRRVLQELRQTLAS